MPAAAEGARRTDMRVDRLRVARVELHGRDDGELKRADGSRDAAPGRVRAIRNRAARGAAVVGRRSGARRGAKLDDRIRDRHRARGGNVGGRIAERERRVPRLRRRNRPRNQRGHAVDL